MKTRKCLGIYSNHAALSIPNILLYIDELERHLIHLEHARTTLVHILHTCRLKRQVIRWIRDTWKHFILPLFIANSFSASRRLLTIRCFSSISNFFLLASSHLKKLWSVSLFTCFSSTYSPFSIIRWSGRRRESVGATPSSGSLSSIVNLVKLCIFSAPFLKHENVILMLQEFSFEKNCLR